MDRDKQDFEQWLKDKNLKPARRQQAIWLVIWRASRETLPKDLPKRHSFITKLLKILG